MNERVSSSLSSQSASDLSKIILGWKVDFQQARAFRLRKGGGDWHKERTDPQIISSSSPATWGSSLSGQEPLYFLHTSNFSCLNPASSVPPQTLHPVLRSVTQVLTYQLRGSEDLYPPAPPNSPTLLAGNVLVSECQALQSNALFLFQSQHPPAPHNGLSKAQLPQCGIQCNPQGCPLGSWPCPADP